MFFLKKQDVFEKNSKIGKIFSTVHLKAALYLRKTEVTVASMARSFVARKSVSARPISRIIFSFGNGKVS